MEALFLGLAFLAGICVGSFLNVCVYRIPRGESVVFPPSRCPSCLRGLKPADLIPLVSYIALKGRCRHCGSVISAQYPLVELAAGMLFLLAALKYGPTLDALRAAILCAVVLAAAVIDLRHRVIPDRITLAGMTLGVPFLFQSREALLSGAAGFLAGGGLLLLIAALSRGGMGGGDIKLAAVMGLFLGWQHILVALFLAFAAGGAAGMLMVLFKLKRMKDAVPFGPYLALGAAAAALAGGDIISWYGRFFG